MSVAAPVRCFLLEPTPTVRVTLVRYVLNPLAWASGRAAPECPGPLGYHHAEALAGVEEACWELPLPGVEREEWPRLDDGFPDFERGPWRLVTGDGYRQDPRWPSTCSCGYVFSDEAERRVNGRLLYRRAGTPELVTLEDAPVGALWFAWWVKQATLPPQLGPSPLYVRLPNGLDWSPDSRASNCSRPADRTHHCWVAHGRPPHVSVDKAGDTCGAGSGSIGSGEPGSDGYWHGYLRAGELITA